MSPPVPPVLKTVALACNEAGGRALLVGGGVRDWLLGGTVKDWDLEVHGLPEDQLYEVLRRIGRVNTVGRAFGVFKLQKSGLEIDIGLPRTESQQGPGHRDIAVRGDPFLPVREAARRRDLTINAILYDLLTDEIVDPWNGLADIEAKILRPVDPETFLDDPLRALRAVQFAARLRFDVSDELVAVCARAELGALPPERILGEWAKLFLKGAEPSRGIDLARRSGVSARLFPEHVDSPDLGRILDGLTALRGVLVPEGRALALMIGGWLSATPATAHEALLDRLGLHKHLGFPTRLAVLAMPRARGAAISSDADLRRLATRCEPRISLWVRALADRDPSAHAAAERCDLLGLSESPEPPLLLGRHLPSLGMAPGPAMGDLLKSAYEAQIDGSVRSLEDALAFARESLIRR